MSKASTASADHREVYKKQSGGRGKFADIVFTMEPAEEGKQGLEFINLIKGGNIPREFIPSVEKAVKVAREEHCPVLVHVVEVTQPQGHSTSGSHEDESKIDR